MRWKQIVIFLGMILILMGCTPQEVDEVSPESVETPPAEAENDIDDVPEADDLPPIGPGESFTILLVSSTGEDYMGIASSLSAGFRDWVDAENGLFAEEGIELEVIELGLDEESPNVSSDLTRAILEYEPVVIVAAVPITDEIIEVFNEVEIPVLSFGFGIQGAAPGNEEENLFSLVPDANEQGAFVVSEIWRNWSEVAPSPVMTQARLAYAHAEQRPSSTVEPFKQFLQDNGYILSVEASGFNETGFDAANFLIDARFSQATMIYFDGSPAMVERLLRDASNLAASDFFVYSVSVWAADWDVLNLMAEIESSPDLFIPLPVVWWEQVDHPAIIQAEEIFARSDREGATKDLGYLMGLAAGDICTNAILSARNQASGGKLSGEDVIGVLEGLENYEAAGGLLSVDFSGGKRTVNWLRLWVVNSQGKWMPVGDGGAAPDLE